MRVVCVRYIDAATGVERSHDRAMTIGSEHVVLAIEIASDGRRWLRVDAEGNGQPALFDARMFGTTSGHIPSNWRLLIDEDGGIRVGPETWLRRGFWEEFFDQSPSAIKTYEDETAIIMAETAAWEGPGYQV